MKGTVSIQINRVTSNTEGDFMRMVIGDEASHVTPLEIKMSREQYGDLVSGRGIVTNAEWHNLEKVGKYLEHKMCEVRLPVSLHRALQTFGDETSQAELVAFKHCLSEHETDGFKATAALTTFQNAHKYHAEENDMVAEIRYVRWVDEPVG